MQKKTHQLLAKKSRLKEYEEQISDYAGIDWEFAKANAIKHPEQKNSNVIAIGTDGKPVNMDLWEYVKIENGTKICLNSISDLSGGNSSWKSGYKNENIADGKIIGKVPQYIKEENGEFLPVTSMLMTFYGCMNLVEEPELPSTLEETVYTFMNCSNLEKISSLPNGVKNIAGIYLSCSKISSSPIIPDGVENMTSSFLRTNIEKTPYVPNSVVNMNNTFGSCKNLTQITNLPSKLENMNLTFNGCTEIKEVPEIPKSVMYMNNTFFGCTNLQTAPEIPETVKTMVSTFQGTNIKEAPAIPDGVENMNHTFRECHELIKAPEIPKSVTSMHSTFYNCYKLTGEITINANPTDYEQCFNRCSTDSGAILILRGESDILNELLLTKSANSNIQL